MFYILVSLLMNLCDVITCDGYEFEESDTGKNILNMMTSSNGAIFRVTGHLCGEFTGSRWLPRTKPMTRSLAAFFDLRLNKRLSKQSWGW